MEKLFVIIILYEVHTHTNNMMEFLLGNLTTLNSGHLSGLSVADAGPNTQKDRMLKCGGHQRLCLHNL